MSALPIIERELRVRARRSSTSWLRVIVGLLAGLSAVGTLSWAHQFRGASLPGKALFDSLNGLAFVFCLFEGVRQTSDCLSQEKREGTIGFLFLTQLRGVDVVLGKFVAASLDSLYGLLAVFPVMGVALLAGGVTGGEFLRAPLVLLNTLFLALACGLWVSARQREQSRALLVGFALVFAITLLPLPLEMLLAQSGWPSLSPVVAMNLANDAQYRAAPTRFWLSLLIVHALGWTMLLLAGRKLAIAWRDNPAADLTTGIRTCDNDPVSSPELTLSDARNAQPAMELEPAARVAGRQRNWRVLIWTAILFMLFGNFVVMRLLSLTGWGLDSTLITVMYYTGWLGPLVLLAFIAAQVLAEAKRSGALELLLCTPLTPREIVRGHWLALWRHLGSPILITGALATALAIYSTELERNPNTAFISQSIYQFFDYTLRLVRALAVCWMGMYLGLRARTAFTATSQTLLWTIVAPWFANWIFWMIARLPVAPVFSGAVSGFFLIPHLGDSVLGLVYSLALIRWARHRLLTRFGEFAAAN